MIQIKNVTILDLLPHTFKTIRNIALSRAIAALTTKFYSDMSSVMVWADIENASPALLDAMAAEIAAPFYSNDMTTEQKKSIIAAAFVYNSQIGTVSSVSELLSAAFGNGVITEWFDYGGKPYYFKTNVTAKPPLSISRDGYKMFLNNLETVKPKRAKLDEAKFSRSTQTNIYFGAALVKTFRKFTVPAAQLPDEERGFN